MEDVLQPRIVGIARGRCAKGPAHIVAQALTAPVGDIERRVGENEVGLQITQFVLWKLPSLFQRISLSMPRTARFILHRRQVV